MSEHVVAIVQSRIGSTRFPRKCFADLAGRPMILHVMERAVAIPGVHTTIAAIPEGDTELENVLRAARVPVFLGPEHDVLHRFRLAADSTTADWILRVTGDCPLWCPDVGGWLLQMWRDSDRQPMARLVGQAEYLSNDTRSSGFPDGTDVELMSARLLRHADDTCRDPHAREHVGPALRLFVRRDLILKSMVDCSAVKVSVDTIEDLARVRTIYRKLPDKRNFSFNQLRMVLGFPLVKQLPRRDALTTGVIDV